ncbi:hypothetical protein ACRRS0_02840 [Agarivorans sp. QJM3NY_29]|uniref:hypothetical protein n=1 Tax=unclassified Agarivorans TaxID=2636026 RepID=UPI003D7D9DD1
MRFASLWDWLVDSLAFYRQHIISFAAMVLPFAIPFSALQSGYVYDVSHPSVLQYWIFICLGLLCQPIYQGASILYIRAQLNQQPWSIAQCFQASLSIWPRLFVVVSISFSLVMLGLNFFVVPGLIFASRLLFADLNCVLYKRSPLQSLNDSWRQTDVIKWPLLAGVIIVSGISILPVWAIDHWLVAQHASNFWFFANKVLGQLLDVFFLVFAYRAYSGISDVTEEP